jgi:tRNA (cmo5U34)-methyltransferase
MTFSFDTIQNFDDHISMSIPDYDQLREHVSHFANYLVRQDSLVYDLGCSTGKLLFDIAELTGKGNYIGVDNCDNVLAQNTRSHELVRLVKDDLVTMDYLSTDLFLSIFTLQFLQGDDRLTVIQKMHDALKPNGSVIVAEKMAYEDKLISSIFSTSYTAFKQKSFSLEEIVNKQEDLKDIMFTLPEAEIIEQFYDVGFTEFIPFWQSLNFKAWIIRT